MHMMRRMTLVVTGLSALTALTATAEPASALAEPGQRVESMLALQRGGGSASPVPQAASPEQREKAAERFLKTYDRLVPETFYGTTFGAKK